MANERTYRLDTLEITASEESALVARTEEIKRMIDAANNGEFGSKRVYAEIEFTEWIGTPGNMTCREQVRYGELWDG